MDVFKLPRGVPLVVLVQLGGRRKSITQKLSVGGIQRVNGVTGRFPVTGTFPQCPLRFLPRTSASRLRLAKWMTQAGRLGAARNLRSELTKAGNSSRAVVSRAVGEGARPPSTTGVVVDQILNGEEDVVAEVAVVLVVVVVVLMAISWYAPFVFYLLQLQFCQAFLLRQKNEEFERRASQDSDKVHLTNDILVLTSCVSALLCFAQATAAVGSTSASEISSDEVIDGVVKNVSELSIDKVGFTFQLGSKSCEYESFWFSFRSTKIVIPR